MGIFEMHNFKLGIHVPTYMYKLDAESRELRDYAQDATSGPRLSKSCSSRRQVCLTILDYSGETD